ncbi:hypothetical protein [Candidatus Bathycorpusculum sp.]|uniref:hypothetical protein n=1 Tax=Candidatus Bathycorpusculum sp. TaxID=2994959 RepID=UPI00281F192B|nr:hypothetical protein [Candidatus Termitimicrobium sp.]MCL2432067.1 hypothetical protein [Candidatus Termitimicrobium sp.]
MSKSDDNTNDPLYLYDTALADSEDLDHFLGGTHYVDEIIKIFGKREEFAKKMGLTSEDKSATETSASEAETELVVTTP